MDTESLHTLLVDKREILEGIIHKDIYRYQRYDIPFSVAIFGYVRVKGWYGIF